MASTGSAAVVKARMCTSSPPGGRQLRTQQRSEVAANAAHGSAHHVQRARQYRSVHHHLHAPCQLRDITIVTQFAGLHRFGQQPSQLPPRPLRLPPYLRVQFLVLQIPPGSTRSRGSC
jgi:hypothetical protein